MKGIVTEGVKGLSGTDQFIINKMLIVHQSYQFVNINSILVRSGKLCCDC